MKNWTIQEQCKMYLCGHFCGVLFSRIHLSREYRENKSLAKNKLIYSIWMQYGQAFTGEAALMKNTKNLHHKSMTNAEPNGLHLTLSHKV